MLSLIELLIEPHASLGDVVPKTHTQMHGEKHCPTLVHETNECCRGRVHEKSAHADVGVHVLLDLVQLENAEYTWEPHETMHCAAAAKRQKVKWYAADEVDCEIAPYVVHGDGVPVRVDRRIWVTALWTRNTKLHKNVESEKDVDDQVQNSGDGVIVHNER